jgi:CheY-like chemotaxis protein
MGGKITAISRGKKFTPESGIVEDNHPDQNTQRLGTIFQVELPVISVEPQRLSPDRWLMMTDRPEIAPAPTAPSHRILIADPVAENHRILANSLVSLNFKVQKVSNEKDLISVWSSWQPHLILIHEQIARINDFQVMRQIQQRQSDRTATFNFDRQTFMMVLITSESEDERSALCSAGANSWIHESSPAEIILQQIAKSLGVHDLYSTTRLYLNCPDLGRDKIAQISAVSPSLAFPQKLGSDLILPHHQSFSQPALSSF